MRAAYAAHIALHLAAAAELQTASLCGMHCLNTLLQSWAFTEVDLALVSSGDDRSHTACVPRESSQD